LKNHSLKKYGRIEKYFQENVQSKLKDEQKWARAKVEGANKCSLQMNLNLFHQKSKCRKLMCHEKQCLKNEEQIPS